MEDKVFIFFTKLESHETSSNVTDDIQAHFFSEYEYDPFRVLIPERELLQLFRNAVPLQLS